MLITDLGLTGTSVPDPKNKDRIWTVTAVYGPAEGRHLGGVRIKLVDQKDFVTFCNQRDFEVLIELARPKDYCKWTGKPYPAPDDVDWFGFCMDQTDLEDDLYERELAARATSPTPVLQAAEAWRRIHASAARDAEDCWVLLWDRDPETGYAPDTRLETIYSRWTCVSRDWIEWQRI
jgi:hypothetical protein